MALPMGIREVPKEMTVGSSIGPTASEYGCVSWKGGETRALGSLGGGLPWKTRGGQAISVTTRMIVPERTGAAVPSRLGIKTGPLGKAYFRVLSRSVFRR